MATELEQIAIRRTAIWVEINAGPSKPNYTLGAKSVSWTEYRMSLYEELKLLRDQELLMSGPYIIKQQMR